MRGIKAKGKWMAWVKNYRNVFIAIKVADSVIIYYSVMLYNSGEKTHIYYFLKL